MQTELNILMNFVSLKVLRKKKNQQKKVFYYIISEYK